MQYIIMYTILNFTITIFNISKNNLCKKMRLRATEVNLKFSDQLKEALIGGENFFE
jgi:hypothetical protein